MFKIPWQSLSPDALNGVIDAYVLKEGTDYGVGYGAGQQAPTLDAKRASVVAQLEAGTALIVFDPATEATDLIPTADYVDPPSAGAEDDPTAN